MKQVLFVVSEVGYSWDEVVLPYLEFKKAGWQVSISTPNGKFPQPDALSYIPKPRWLNWFGVGTSKKVGPDSEVGNQLLELFKKSQVLSKVRASDYQAIYIAGGHGALFDLNKNSTLHKLILEFDAQQRVIGILCHASSTLAFINSGDYLRGRNVTGFPTLWEYFILSIGYIEKRFLPLPIWTGKELDKWATGRTLFTRLFELLDPSYIVSDGKLISGVGPESGSRLARKMIQHL